MFKLNNTKDVIAAASTRPTQSVFRVPQWGLLILLGLWFSTADAAILSFYLPCDEVSGTKMVDIAGNRSGVAKGTSWVSGRIGQALYFDGKEKGEGELACVNFPLTVSEPFLQSFDDTPFAISLWFKPDPSKNTKIHQDLLNTGSDKGPGWRLIYSWGSVIFRSGDGNSYWDVKSVPARHTVVIDAWNHVAISRDNDGILSLYLNGALAGQSSNAFVVTPKPMALCVGAYGGGAAYAFRGAMDEIKFFKGALTPAEIYQLGRSVKVASRLTLDGRLDEALWKESKRFTGMYAVDGNSSAVQTSALVVWDESNFYFGFRCPEPRLGSLRKNQRTNALSVYQDDCVELMLDADGNRADYYHFLVNPLGFLAAEFRSQSGHVGSEVPSRTFQSAASVGDGEWTAELVVPFASLVEERILRRVTLNLARNRRVDLPKIEESALTKGKFHDPSLFFPVDLGDLDLSPYDFTCTLPRMVDSVNVDGKCKARLSFEIRNGAKSRKAKLGIGVENSGMLAQLEISLAPGERREISLNAPFVRSATYPLSMTVQDGDRLLFEAIHETKIDVSSLNLELSKPFFRGSFYATEKSDEITGVLKAAFSEAELSGAEIVSTLRGPTGENMATGSQRIQGRETALRLPLKSLGEGLYQLELSLRKGGNELASLKRPISQLGKAPGSEVRLGVGARMIVNGKPTLPIFWWGGGSFDEIAATGGNGIIVQHAREMEDAARVKQFSILRVITTDIGKNYIIGKSTLSAEGKAVIASNINLAKASPWLLCYYLEDEPEVRNIQAGVMEEVYRLLCELDPWHPVMICNDSVGGLHQYRDAHEMFFPDPYVCPKDDGSLSHPMSYVSTFIDEAVKAGRGRMLIGFTPQVFNYADFGKLNNRAPTFVEERCMIYLAIIHGARGLSLYKYGNPDWQSLSRANKENAKGAVCYPDLKLGMPFLIKELRALEAPLLAGREIPGVNTGTEDIHAVLIENAGKQILIACNVTDREMTPEIAALLASGDFKVLSEARSVSVSKGKLKDKFGPYATHLYSNDPALGDGLSLAKCREEIAKAGGFFEFTYR